MKYEQIFIKSEQDLPEKFGEYIAHAILIRRVLMHYRYYKPDKKHWLKYVDWYLRPIPEITDEDIETWAKSLCYNIYENPQEDNSIVKLRYLSLTEGAKAMRDGLIKQSKSK